MHIFPYSDSRELGMNVPLFIHWISSSVFWSVTGLPSHWFPVAVDPTRSVSGVRFPIGGLGVFSWSQSGVPFLLPCSLGNPSRSCVVSFQESDVPRERGQSLRAAHVFRVRTVATLRVGPLTCVSCSLDLQRPMTWTPTSLLDYLMP